MDWGSPFEIAVLFREIEVLGRLQKNTDVLLRGKQDFRTAFATQKIPAGPTHLRIKKPPTQASVVFNFIYYIPAPLFPLLAGTKVEDYSHNYPDNEADNGFFAKRASEHRDRYEKQDAEYQGHDGAENSGEYQA